MKICILSDSHDHTPRLDQAIAYAKTWGAEAVLHCGDVVAPSTLHGLARWGLPMHVIHGNNTGDLFAFSKMSGKPQHKVHYYGQDASLNLGGARVFLVHYPHYAQALALTGDWDLVCCGHSHIVSIEHLTNIKGGITHLVNPGTVGGVGQAPATFILADLATWEFTVQTLVKT
jgi:putative phosphoesterase